MKINFQVLFGYKNHLNNINSSSQNKKNQNKNNFNGNSSVAELSSYPKNYFFLNFEGKKVDKDLDSFYLRNKDRMPKTVKEYIEQMPDEERKIETPMTAQMHSFELLPICESVEDIKDVYSDEPLFQNLKSAKESRAPRGLLGEMRIIAPDIEQDGEEVLKDNQDLTVYLVKKIFFEGKTIDEINQDLDNDLHEFFKNDEKNYVSSTTLKALGIQLPQREYLTSLRYTRDGYSDKIGDRISETYQNKSEEEKKELIKKRKEAIDKKREADGAQQTSNSKDKETKTDSTNNHRQGHSVSDKTKSKLSEIGKKRWEKLTPEEKTEVINNLQQGNEQQRTIMTCAWNKLPEVRKDLSLFLLQNNFYSPESIIYRNYALTSSMKVVMDTFWKQYPQHATNMGEAIEKSRQEYEEAKSGPNFKEFVDKTFSDQAKAKKEIKEINKTYKATKAKMPVLDQYKTMFSFLPKSILSSQLDTLKTMPDGDIKLWIKYCRGDKLSPKEIKKAENIEEKVFPRISNEAQTFIQVAINNFEECLKPVENQTNGKSLHPVFPTNIDFRFKDISALYFSAKKSGYENVNLGLSLNDEYYTKLIKERNPKIRLNQDLMKDYKYKFDTEPDFDKIAKEYEEIIGVKHLPQYFLDKMKIDTSDDKTAQVVYNLLTLQGAYNYSFSLDKEYCGGLFRITKLLDALGILDNNKWNNDMIEAYEHDFIDALALSQSELSKEKERLLDEFKTEFSFLPKDMFDYQLNKLKNLPNNKIELWLNYLKGEEGEAIKNPELEELTRKMLPRKEMENYINALAVEMFDCLQPIVNHKTGKKSQMPPGFCFDFRKDYGELVGIIYKIKHNTYNDKDFPVEKTSMQKLESFAIDNYGHFPNAIKNYRFKLAKTPDANKINSNYKKINQAKYSKQEREEIAVEMLGSESSDNAMLSCLLNNLNDSDIAIIKSSEFEGLHPPVYTTILARMKTEFVKKSDTIHANKISNSQMVVSLQYMNSLIMKNLFI